MENARDRLLHIVYNRVGGQIMPMHMVAAARRRFYGLKTVHIVRRLTLIIQFCIGPWAVWLTKEYGFENPSLSTAKNAKNTKK